MTNYSQLIAATKRGDVEKARELLEHGVDAHQPDEQGWTALGWAAGRGDSVMVRLLLEHGADVTPIGRDDRTPLMIARAAGHGEVVNLLTAAEKERGVWEDPRETRPYCKAFHLGDLRKFPGWREQRPTPDDEPQPLSDESIVYLHQDFTVTRSMWHGEDVIFDDVTPEWQRFCEQEIGFVPQGIS